MGQTYLALGATDFRKQQNGLASLVALKFKLDPHSGTSVFLFCNKRHNSLRALRWDRNGFILVTKSLSEEMKFQWPKNQGEVRDITWRQLEWLLQGLQIDQKKAAHTTLICVRYMMLAVENRENKDGRASGNIFYEFCDEIADLDFTKAFLYILDLFTTILRENLFLSELVINQILVSFMAKLPGFIRKRLYLNAA